MFNKVEEVETPKEEPVYTPPVAEKRMPDLSSRPSSKSVSGEVSVLTESMIINGNIATEGALEVRGRIVGNVEALGKLNITGEIQGNSQAAEIYAEGARITGELRSQGSIKIGQNAVVLGNVYANSAVIAGAIRGDLDIRGPVILDTSAIVMGDIKSKSVQINNGAVIEGMCSQCYAEVNPTSFFEELKKMK
ncbi:MAG: polymer-forming cytoskeletal protein [Lachnospiraceae bacterium]|nr:polymer-forming cytoskeletal protein [Lachnospiraceae bacterium]